MLLNTSTVQSVRDMGEDGSTTVKAPVTGFNVERFVMRLSGVKSKARDGSDDNAEIFTLFLKLKAQLIFSQTRFGAQR